MAEALAAGTTGKFDFLSSYVDDLPSVLDLNAIREAGVRIGADPMGGASVDYWGEIGERHHLNLTVVNPTVDPQWAFMTLDWDEKIRMDCSSPSAMASLINRMSDGAKFDVATGNDADADRHGIVTPDGGLMNPNHYLAVAIDYLYRHRTGWNPQSVIGKTLVSSSIIDRVAESLGRKLVEVPGGLQVVRPRAAVRRGRLRRRGIRRRLVLQDGRERLDHGQGWHPAGPAGLGDHGGDGQVTVAAVQGPHRPVRRPRLRPDRRGRHPGAEGGARASSRRRTSPRPNWPAKRSRPN